VVMNDSGQLFIYALLVFVSCLILAWSYRDQVFHLFQKQKSPWL
jgi:hypothetical protein